MVASATILGLELYEWLTLLGIVLSPIAAVLITLWVERRRRDQEQQVQTLRMLLTTRHLPADPAYSVAINLVPVEFSKHKRVMTAWSEYIEAVRFAPTPENAEAAHEKTRVKQTRLIYEITRVLKLGLSETDIQSSAYASEGYIKRDNLVIDAQLAWREIADALKVQTEVMLADRRQDALQFPPLVDNLKQS